ncbi:alpha/beta-hydrolase family protein [Demequina sp.]|uniref:alpha/beta-hydrolase family protein n=1 Tax=Demequina sp. TaxID=2050685 RepID=UPI003D0DB0C5
MTYPRWARLDYGGVLVGLVFVALSMTPSMLPRPWYYQGAVSGMSFAGGYALGVALWQVVRWAIRWRNEWLTVWGWAIITGVWAVLFVVLVRLATEWQNGVREAVGWEPLDSVQGWLLLGVAVVVAAVCVAIGRAIARVYRHIRIRTGHLFDRRGWRGSGALATLSATGVTAFGLVLAWLVLSTGVVLFLDSRWEVRNNAMDAEYPRPTSELRSGGPGSLVAWEDVGSKGRSVVASGPSAQQISQVTGAAAIEPIRIYVGLNSAPSYEARAELAVKELERTHAEERAVLVLPGLTGTGWLEPQAIDSLEYLHGGDTAMVAAQYSVSPSWVSSVFHPEQSIAGTSALYTAVKAWWDALPAGTRPQLVVYGVSLGAQALQESFGTVDALVDGVDGAVFAGTPAITDLSTELRAERDPGSPVTWPVVSSQPHVQFFPTADAVQSFDGTWAAPRIAYLEHGNDPVVWMDWSIFYKKPEWLSAGQRSPDIADQMVFIPLITGLQGLADMAMAEGVPDDAGHRYGDATFLSWVQITGSSGLDQAALDRIQAVIDSYDAEAPISQ